MRALLSGQGELLVAAISRRVPAQHPDDRTEVPLPIAGDHDGN
jgi:hypothetical protein